MKESLDVLDEKLIYEDADQLVQEDYEVTREKLIHELNNSKIENAAYKDFILHLNTLNNNMSTLMKPDQSGWPLIKDENLSLLKKNFKDTSISMEKFLAENKNVKDPDLKNVFIITKKLADILSSEQRTIIAYNPKKEEKTLPDLLDDARSKVVDLRNKKIETVGGNMSQRIPMSIKGIDGKTIHGYFTKDSYCDPVASIGSMLAKTASKAKSNRGASLINNFLEKYNEYYSKTENKSQDHPVDDKIFMTYNFLRSFIGKGNNITNAKFSTDKFFNELAKVNGISVEAVEGLCGKKAAKEFCKMAKADLVHFLGYKVAGLEDKTRIDTRNTAMSTVAELLDLGHVICHSQSIKIKTQDGSVVDGTFMEESPYVDPNHPGIAGQYVNKSTFENHNGQGYRDIADIQVLDYLCGNVDRHGGNVFIKFDEYGKFAGAQGIDNDASFGRIYSDKNDVNMMVVPKNMGFISSNTANKVLGLNSAQLEFSLRGLVSEIEILAAKKRLENLKNAIKLSRDMVREGDTNNKNRIVELDDESWKNLTHDDMIKRNNLFKRAVEAIEDMPKLAADSVKNNMIMADNINRATKDGIENQLDHAKKFDKLLNSRTSSLRTSDNYENMQKAVKEYKRLVNKINTRIKNAENAIASGDNSVETLMAQYTNVSDLEILNKAMNNVQKVASTYYEEKRKEFSKNGKKPGSYTKARMDAAKEIIDFAKENQKITSEEKMTIKGNLRRVADFLAKNDNKGKNKDNNKDNNKVVNERDKIKKDSKIKKA
ncbi:MAG: hypothetical protein K6E10_06580 [Eubacterium sp.]|nr:hypothetical protein [Eubacterium sp.]